MLKRCALCLACNLLVPRLVLAHEDEVSGLVYTTPQSPQPEKMFTLTVELVDPRGALVADARLILTIESTAITVVLAKTEMTGVYTTSLNLPEGFWRAQLSDQTLAGENSVSKFGLRVGATNPDTIEILFPASNETPRSLIVGLFTLEGLAFILLLYWLRVKGWLRFTRQASKR